MNDSPKWAGNNAARRMDHRITMLELEIDSNRAALLRDARRLAEMLMEMADELEAVPTRRPTSLPPFGRRAADVDTQCVRLYDAMAALDMLRWIKEG